MEKRLPDARLSRWQPAVAGKNRNPVSLADFDPKAKPYSLGAKERDQRGVEALAGRVDQLQDLFFADKRFKLLVVLQGTDGSGKDGTIRDVFARTSPLGVRVMGWKAPTEEERAHDFLWRIHRCAPGAGEVMVFNRSHYEDVLVPRVNGSITAEQTRQRYAQINDFERLLCENGTVILKFMLHISKDEQRMRLQARIDDPTKRWKVQLNDLEVRKRWGPYQRAYAAMLGATSTPWARWTIVPADSKSHRNLMVATVLRDALEDLGLRYPPGDAGLKRLKVR